MTTNRQIKALEQAQKVAWEQGWTEEHARITAMLKPLYKEQEQASRDKVERCAEVRRKLPAYRVFTSGMN